MRGASAHVRDLPRRQGSTIYLRMKFVSWWVEQSPLAEVGAAFAGLLVLMGVIVLAGAIWTGWRYWVRSLAP